MSHVLRLVSVQFHHTYDMSFGVALVAVVAEVEEEAAEVEEEAAEVVVEEAAVEAAVGAV